MKKLKPKQLLKSYLNDALATATPRTALCPHFGECGGCEYQTYFYADQVHAKAAVWQKLVTAAALTLPPAEIVASPIEYGYRQRMDYVFAFATAGLRRRGSHRRVVALRECPLLGARGFAAFSRARDLALAAGLEDYNYLRHTGFLRYFVVRQTRRGEILLSLVTKTPEHAAILAEIAQTLLSEKLAHSVYWLVQAGLADLSFGEVKHFWGAPYIYENYGDQTFAIAANTFAQANPAVAEIAYQKIVATIIAANNATNAGEKIVADAYSGTGVIGQLLSPHCAKIIAVENVAANVELARFNQTHNRVTNVEIINADAANFFNALATPAAAFNLPREFSAVVVNPPRSGLGEKNAAALGISGVPRIIYLACNPQTLIADLKILFANYRATQVCLFDMFPQTHHWETLVELEKISGAASKAGI